MRKFIGKFLAAGLCVAMALSSVTVKADSVDQKYLALGADLTVSQKKKVLELLDLDDNSDYKVITVTNKDEHEYLDSYLSSRVIGTRALSSVTVEQKDDGNGVNVTTQNISYCTSGMYRNALITAGIKNADVKVAGPFKISGTAALVGVMKAYEEMTGKKIPADYRFVKSQPVALFFGGWCLFVTAACCIMGVYSTDLFTMALNIITPVVLTALGIILPAIAKREKANAITE